MARSELNSLLDRAVDAERRAGASRDPDEDLYKRFSLDQLSDAELEAEIERRYRTRQAAHGQSARTTARTTSRASEGDHRGGGSGASGRTSARSSGSGSAKRHAPPDELRLAYAALEVPYGADFATVRKSYRVLMRKYHPDRHAASPEKQRAATELAQKLTAAYDLIEKRSRR